MEENNQQSPDQTSEVAILLWLLAALGIMVAIINLLNSEFAITIEIASLVGSSITLFWMGHVVNYLKQIANKLNNYPYQVTGNPTETPAE